MQVVQEISGNRTETFVQILEDGSVFECQLPIGSNFNDGSGVIWYVNRGFVPKSEYDARQHSRAVSERRAEEEPDAKAEKTTKKVAK